MNSGALKWGLIVCGDISRKRVAPALRDLPNCELVAVCRANPELAEAFAKECGARKSYREWQDLLADPEIDAVYIATPVHLHAEQTIAAAAAGKHVLCEKPMALTVAECDRMIFRSANNVKLGIATIATSTPSLAVPEISQRRNRHPYNCADQCVRVVRSDRIIRDTGSLIREVRRWAMFDFGCHRIEVLLTSLDQSVTRRQC